MTRKAFLAQLSVAAAATTLPAAANTAEAEPHIATNTYPWGTFYQREGKEFKQYSEEALAAIAATGIRGYEPAIFDPAALVGLGERLQKHGLEMRSLYVNSLLHEEAAAADSISKIMAIASAAAPLGTKIIVTNPSPLKWGGTELKTDAHLKTQAKALDTLGKQLADNGMQLAYHNHDMELKAGGREFHHMLTATDPALVKFCLDLHWVFRGCGDSQVALFDAMKHYGSRVIELHLRQSLGGKWTEAFSAQGDIDYQQAADFLKKAGCKPLLVLEQAVEGGTPKTMDCQAAHKASLAAVQKLF